MPQPEFRIAAIPLDPPPLNITDVWVEDDGNRLLGTVHLFGRHFHAEFLKVANDGDGHQKGCGEYAELYERLQTYDGDSDDFTTVFVPGFEGEYVLVITSYKE